MRLFRSPKGYCFETKFAAVGKHFGKGYFITFLYPFVGYGKSIYQKVEKPKFRNLYALSAIFFLPYLAMAALGLLWMFIYTMYTVLGVANVVNGIKESRELGGLINLVAIFCLTAFYLIGVFSLIKWLVW